MKEELSKYRRRSIRLKQYDYATAGAYFITICTQNREYLFGNIVGANGVRPGSEMILNEYGDIVCEEWLRTSEIRREILLNEDEYVVMPNHFHAIVFITDSQPIVPISRGDRPVAPTEKPAGPKSKSLGTLMAGYKSVVTKRINELRGTPGSPVWQRNYYEHIIRNEKELNETREYILCNPANWDKDDEYNTLTQRRPS